MSPMAAAASRGIEIAIRRRLQLRSGSVSPAPPASRNPGAVSLGSPGAVQLRLGCAHRDLHHLRDLAVPVALHIVKDEHLLSPIGQPFDGLLEVHRELRRPSRGDGPVHGRPGGDETAPPGSGRAPFCQGQVDADLVEPGPEGRFPTETVQLLPGPYEDLLRQIVGPFPPDHAPRQSVHPSDVPPVQPLERPTVSRRGESHIRGVLIRDLEVRSSLQLGHSLTPWLLGSWDGMVEVPKRLGR